MCTNISLLNLQHYAGNALYTTSKIKPNGTTLTVQNEGRHKYNTTSGSLLMA